MRSMLRLHVMITEAAPPCSQNKFLGGLSLHLSLHLNHLIGSHMTNYNWPFGTVPFALFLVKFGHKGP